MKTYTGSLQKRGRRWYLVIHRPGHQHWVALKTDKLPVARMRAAKIAPSDPDDEAAWLRQLVREGDRARRALARIRARKELTWANICENCSLSGVAESSVDSRRSHGRWLDILHGAVANRRLQPGDMTRDDAVAAMRRVGFRYLSAPRMLRFFRHAWDALGLDASIWPRATAVLSETVKQSARYRRLSVDEVRHVYRHLKEAAPPLADMVLLGYSTGLRLSDVAELELSEIDGAFLRVCPNKTRRNKPHPLKIPLVPEARAVVHRLAACAQGLGCPYVFAASDRHRPSRRIVAAFRACGIARSEKVRASFHSLRATFISLMDEAGIPPHMTDSITGHGGGGMHARYTQPSDAALIAAVTRALPRLAPGEGMPRGLP